MNEHRPSSPETPARRTVEDVITLIRLARVLVTLALAALAISLVVGVMRPETGVLEKVVLFVLFAGCVFLAAKVSTWATSGQARRQKHGSAEPSVS